MASESSSRTLNGWKEIAAHLGKSIRSVQRWERDLGLPVHRINTPDHGQIVYADSQEIDGWLRRMDEKELANGAAPESPEAQPPAAAPTRPLSRWWFGAAVVVVLLLAVLAEKYWTARERDTPATFAFVGRELLAVGDDGTVLWRHDFSERVSSPVIFDYVRGRAIADNDGGFIVPIRFGPKDTNQPARTDRVVAFDRNGWVRWEVEPDLEMTSGSRHFAGPWHVVAIVAGADEQSGRTWVAYQPNTWMPSFVVEVESNGHTSIRFAQSGWVTSLALWRDNGADWLVAGGVSNEHQRASLAFIDLNADAAQGPPSDGPPLACPGCPVARPLAYVLFPPSEVGSVSEKPYAMATDIVPLGSLLKVQLSDSRVAFVDAVDHVASLDFTDAYWTEHRAAEADGLIDHSAQNCPERSGPKPVRLWTPEAGWTTVSVAAASK